KVIREISKHKAYAYEFSIRGRVFLAHVAALKRMQGFVVICNDVTTLKELDRMKSEMVRMTSHDLKNPLQAAMANLELLRDDLNADSNPDVQVAIDEIGRQLQRMYRIIRGILDLERVRSGSIVPEWCSAADLARQALEEIRHSALEKQIALVDDTVDKSTMLYGDSEQLIRALVNLLENAIKFTPRGGTVTLSLAESEGEVIFSVRDTGIGIRAEVQEHVFERFFRARQQGTDHVSGTGLGLSLVKTIVDNHRGRVWLTSQVNVGSEFYIAIPAQPRLEATTRPAVSR
ncbi:MAG: HAMP domain-containing histidine kinase, partial [Anaerolinea sp.]|nr:HAMP domain-containing histidine kinase [Anaerolinea sp.]